MTVSIEVEVNKQVKVIIFQVFKLLVTLSPGADDTEGVLIWEK